jgi:hypothetical protein
LTTQAIDGEYTEVETRDLVAVPQGGELSLNIDVEAMVKRRDQFHAFIDTILKPDVHYGIPKQRDGTPVPGIPRRFLYQAGAEEIFSAFECRPRYTTMTSTVDAKSGTVIFVQKCEAVGMSTGYVMGEGVGAVSNDEFVTNCKFSSWAERGHDGTVVCPEHGRGRAKVWNNPSSIKLQCQGKTQEAFHKVLHNALMRANKRAMVACARTLGCASEFFSQDAEMVTGGADLLAEEENDGRKGSQAAPLARQQPQQGAGDQPVGGPKGTWWPAPNGDLMINCPNHGVRKGREWDRGDSVTCTAKVGEGWCDFKVAKEGGTPPGGAPGNPRSVSAAEQAIARAREHGVEAADAKEFMETVYNARLGPNQQVTKTYLSNWLVREPEQVESAEAWADKLIAWFDLKYPLDGSPQENLDRNFPDPQQPFAEEDPAYTQEDYLMEAAGGEHRAASNCPADMAANPEYCHVFLKGAGTHCHAPMTVFTPYGAPLCDLHSTAWEKLS